MCKKIIFPVLVVILLLVSTASAHKWTAGGGTDRSWTNPANWDSPLPTIADSTKLYTVSDETDGPLVNTTTAISKYVRVGGPGGIYPTDYCTLTIVDGGVLTVAQWIMAGTDSGTDGGRSGALNMEGGLLDLGTGDDPSRGNLNIAHSYASLGFLYMSGGVINAPGAFFIGKNDGARGEAHLDGGVIYSGDFWMATGDVGCSASMDITGGTLILEGNDTAAIADYISYGWLTGYGTEDDIRYDYDDTNTGKTTVWAVPEPATICILAIGAFGLRRRK